MVVKKSYGEYFLRIAIGVTMMALLYTASPGDAMQSSIPLYFDETISESIAFAGDFHIYNNDNAHFYFN